MDYLVANSGKAKSITRNGREYLVVPASLIVPGVLNGSKGRLYYSPKHTQKSTEKWNGTPITMYHPTVNGEYVSAKHSSVKHYGWLENARYRNKLTSEAWIDVERTKTHPEGEYVLNRLRQGLPVELSTGLYTEDIERNGIDSRSGQAYTHLAVDYRPDHLAILPSQTGACSLRDGCGLNVNAKPCCDECKSGKSCSGSKPMKKCPECSGEMTVNKKGVMTCNGCGYKAKMGPTSNAKKGGGANCGIGPGGFSKGNKCAGGGGGVSNKLYRSTTSGAPNAVWKKAMDKADKQAVATMKSDIPGFGLHKITGDHVHEPRVEGSTSASMKAIKDSLKKAGYKAPGKWNKPDSQTFQHPDGHQVTVSKYEATGGGGGRSVKYYPQYKLEDFTLNTSEVKPPMKKKLVNWLVVNCACWKGQEAVLNKMDETHLKALRQQALAANEAADVLKTVKDTLGVNTLTSDTLKAELGKLKTSGKNIVTNGSGYDKKMKMKKPAMNEDDEEMDDEDDEEMTPTPKGKKKMMPVANTEDDQLKEEYRQVVEERRQELAGKIVSNMKFVSEDARKKKYAKLLKLTTNELREELEGLAPVTANTITLDDETPPGYVPSRIGAGVVPTANRGANNQPLEPIPVESIDWSELSAFGK